MILYPPVSLWLSFEQNVIKEPCMTTWDIFPWYNPGLLEQVAEMFHGRKSETVLAYNQFSSHYVKSSRRTWALSITQQLWITAAEDKRESFDYPCCCCPYQRLITGQCLTKTPRGQWELAARLPIPFACSRLVQGRKWRPGRAGMMLWAMSTYKYVCTLKQKKNKTGNIKTRRCQATILDQNKKFKKKKEFMSNKLNSLEKYTQKTMIYSMRLQSACAVSPATSDYLDRTSLCDSVLRTHSICCPERL